MESLGRLEELTAAGAGLVGGGHRKGRKLRLYAAPATSEDLDVGASAGLDVVNADGFAARP